MLAAERRVPLRVFAAALVAALAAGLFAPQLVAPARAGFHIPTPCDLPGADMVCDAVGDLAGSAAKAVGDYVMRGVTSWVTNAAVWVTGKVGGLIDATASPNVEADWFRGQYSAMVTVAGALALPMLLLALIQAVWRQDFWILGRAAFGYLPMAFILAGAAIVATQLIVSITDDLSGVVVNGVGDASSNLLQSVGDAYKSALDDTSGDAVPLFGIFIGAIVLAIGAFVLWLEMVIRDAAIYIALFFLPLTFVAMIWPATGRWARRLVELLVAVILAKFVIVSIITLATAALTNTTLAQPDGGSVFERMIAGSALLVLAAWSPFALLRLVPMMEAAAATVVSQRATMSNAAGSAGIQSPAAYMRQAMDRHSRASTSPSYSGAPRTVYMSGSSGDASPAGTDSSATPRASARTGAASEGETRVAYAPPPRRADPAGAPVVPPPGGASTGSSDAAPPAPPPRDDRPRSPRPPSDEA